MTVYKLCDRGLTTATFLSAWTKKPPTMKLHTAAILVIFWLGIFAVHTAKGSVGSRPMRKYSCVNLSTQRLNIQNLVGYEKQQNAVDAVMFINTNGIKICVRSNQNWVQTAMKKIDQRRTTQGQ